MHITWYQLISCQRDERYTVSCGKMITDSHDLTAFVTQYRDWVRDLFFIRGTDRQNEISAAERKPLCSNRAVAFVLAGLSLCYRKPRTEYLGFLCEIRILIGTRVLSVQEVTLTPGLYPGLGVYARPGFCPRFYGTSYIWWSCFACLYCDYWNSIKSKDRGSTSRWFYRNYREQTYPIRVREVVTDHSYSMLSFSIKTTFAMAAIVQDVSTAIYWRNSSPCRNAIGWCFFDRPTYMAARMSVAYWCCVVAGAVER